MRSKWDLKVGNINGMYHLKKMNIAMENHRF